ncbi:MAG: hypothetical protein R3D89_06090 [Sphingomonadaceae bacterium]
MTALRTDVDPDGLLEYSVVFTDRSLNHMSQSFQAVMREIHSELCEVYGADRAVVVPGGGTYGMEAVARQFAHGKKVMVIRNGFFSYRWSQIFEMGGIPASETVLKAQRQGEGPQAPFAPPPIADVVAAIRAEKPDVVFARMSRRHRASSCQTIISVRLARRCTSMAGCSCSTASPRAASGSICARRMSTC